jgi:hypothetical protein
MTIPKVVVAIGALALGLAGYMPRAHAAFTITESVGGTPMDGATLVNFDNLAIGSASGTSGGVGVAFAGGALATSGNSGTYTAPYLSHSQSAAFGDSMASGYDTTHYVSTGIGTITMTFSGPQTYLGLLWGSLDPFNSLSFYNGTALVGVVTGWDVMPINMGSLGPDGTYYVNLLSNMAFDSVVAASGGWSFEIDNLAYAGGDPAPVPEPAAVGLLALGLLGLAYTAARRSARTM